MSKFSCFYGMSLLLIAESVSMNPHIIANWGKNGV